MIRNDTIWAREFLFTDKDFRFLRDMVWQYTGISLSESKRELVYGRLAKRLRLLDIVSFKKYCELLKNDREGHELINLTNAITTNLTSFFREKHHFEYLANRILPGYHSKNKIKIRIWSAGCSSGEEPYSIAMTLKKFHFTTTSHLDIKILATDLDSDVLGKAKDGMYRIDKLGDFKPRTLKKWFLKVKRDNKGYAQIRPNLQDLITFKKLNLIQNWPMKGLFDMIFCRNVIIYFDKTTQKTLIDRFADILGEGGYLFLGHSESLLTVSDRFRLVAQTTYQKTK